MFHHTSWSDKRRIDFYHPEGAIVNFFNCDFQAGEKSDKTERELSIDFEGFRRLKSLEHRYESFGYCKMLQRMLTIEDLTVKKALEDLTLMDQYVSPTSIRHHFVIFYEDRKLSDKLGFNSLVLTPMSALTTGKSLPEIESKRIFNRIIRIDGSRLVFEKSRRSVIDLNTKYRVELVENRMSIRLCHRTFEKIKEQKLEPFLTTFDESTLVKLPAKPWRVGSFIFAPINPSVGSNKLQMQAVKNIVNRSSFPSPYVVFGPPGESLEEFRSKSQHFSF